MSKKVRIPPKDLKFGKNMRTGDLDESLLRELGESMRVRQLQPIIVGPDYTVVIGNRRAHAALLVGLEFVEAEVLDEFPDESTRLMYQWAENFFREQTTDFQKCQVCIDLLELKSSWTAKDVAKWLGVDQSMVSRYVKVNECSIPEVREAFKVGQIGIGAAYSIAKEPKDKQAGMMELSLSGVSRDDLECSRRKQKRRRNGTSRKEDSITAPLASGITVTVRGPKIGMDELNQALVDVQRELRHARDKLHVDDAKDFERVLQRKLKRGTVTEAPHA